MKKAKKIMVGLLLALSLLVVGGCSNNTDQTAASTTATSEVQTMTVNVVLQEDGKEIANKTVEAESGANLFDVMAAAFDVKDDDGFITSIDGHAQDDNAKKYWTYMINDQEVMTGAKDTILNDGDKVVFNLAGME